MRIRMRIKEGGPPSRLTRCAEALQRVLRRDEDKDED
jgi:hypothetical protein